MYVLYTFNCLFRALKIVAVVWMSIEYDNFTKYSITVFIRVKAYSRESFHYANYIYLYFSCRQTEQASSAFRGINKVSIHQCSKGKHNTYKCM